VNTIINLSSESMGELLDDSVHLCVTSPPYNVNKSYEADQSFDEWQLLCRNVFSEVRRVLVPGGRLCVNIANTGRNPYRPLHHFMIGMLLDLGLLMRGEVIWDKGASVGGSTAWGSWMSASNPVLRDVHEYILIFSKCTMKRDKTGPSSITRDEFLGFTKSIWRFPTESSKRIGHPSPFPLELPCRLIQLYSFAGDLVLDPFCGSGTTCVAAATLGRRYVGYDVVADYCDLARKRIFETQLNG
jgi:modification methylase